ncbi:MAG TPA: amino acid adenylation domain-containing protein [Candidatus Angelobacter sp.]|nr:amino acid adenylation domain-containing protein [Candidatus Angelobacter sp.]
MIEYPLSYGQQALWFVHQLDRSSAAYNVHIAFRIYSRLDVDALRSAFQKIVDRHAPLRSTFAERDGVIFQRVAERMEVALSVHDARALDASALGRRLLEEVHRPFDLERGPVFRVALFKTQNAHDLIVMVHHVVVDLWSTILILEELSAYYSGTTIPGTLALEYCDYVRWQTDMLHGDDGERLFQYWRDTLRGDLPVLDLPLDRPRPPVQTFRGRSRRFLIDTHIHTGLRSLAREEGSTQFGVLVAAFQAFLHRLSGQDEVLLGAPTAARSRPEWDALVGHFTNPVIMRANFSDDPTFREICRRAGASVVGAIEHQDFPFPLLVERLQIVRDPARSPLFQAMISFERPHRAEGRNSPAFVVNGEPVRRLLGQLEIEPIPLLNGSSQFDLTLALRESEGNLFATLEYNTDLFNDSTIDRWIRHLLALLEGATKDPDIRVSALPLVGSEELVRLAQPSESRSGSLNSAQLVDKAIAETARCHSNAVAIIDGPWSLSYSELRGQVENLAARLSGLGVGPGDRVGLFTERSADAVVMMLAILEAGAAWLPLDPSLPKARLNALVKDASPKFVLASISLVGQAPGRAISVDVEALLAPPSGSCGEAPAYVMHTSGSTGKPKGVVVSNRALANHALVSAARYEVEPGDRVLHFASLAFDVAIEEIFPTLLAGATLVVRPPGDVPTITEFDTLLREQRITVVNLPASYWHELVAEIDRGRVEIPPHLRLVVVGSERLLPASVSAWSQHVGSRVRLLNAYGTTEATITSTVYEAGASASRDAVDVAIGKPLEGVRVYVVDSQMQLLPVGVPGEALIGGASIALGYLNQPAETADRFIPDPFHESPGARCYRTGDRMQWRPDGNLEFLGRLDEQIKIRGFRIEPGEIEAVLRRHPVVTDAAVVAHRVEGRVLLAAFITPKEIDVEHLKRVLAERLPTYMVPSVFVPLRELPRTANGKLDRRALPSFVDGVASASGARRLACTRAELTLCRIWSDVLGVSNIGIDDNFFALGGDSILAIQVIARARREGIRLTVRQFLHHPTLSALAASAEEAGIALAEQGPVVGEAPLTPIQRWFVEQASPEPHHDNQAVLLELRERPNVQALKAAIGQLMEHHDALRLRLVGHKQRFVAPLGPVPVERMVLDNGAFEEAAARVQASMDLKSGPVFRAVLFENPEGQARLLLCAHHLAVDGVSWRILLEDLASAYQSHSSGENAILPPKTTSFKRWAERLFEYAQSKQLHDEAKLWLDDRLLAGFHAPTDPGLEGEAQSVVASLSPEETQRLLQAAPAAHGMRIDDLLLAALGKALGTLKPGPWLIDVEGHGREELFEDVDLSRTVGWFTTVYPLLLEPPGGDPMMVRDARRNLPHGGIGYGVLRHLAGHSELSTLRSDVCFNYLGQFDQALSNNGPFKLAGEPLRALRSPRARRSHALEINALVSGGCFSAMFTHVEARHSRAVVEQLAATFLEALRELTMTPLPHRDATVEDAYPLTPMQEGMLFHTLLDSGNIYVEQLSWKVKQLDVYAFQQAWDALIARHAILRSAITLQDGQHLQAVRREARPKWDLIDLRGLSPEEKQRRIEDILRTDRAREFELDRAPLLRLTLLRTAEDEHIFAFSHHHILFDGWSLPLLLDELLVLYKAALDGVSAELPLVEPFRNYLDWLARRNPAEWRDFFREALGGFAGATSLPLPFGDSSPEPGEILDGNYARKIREVDSSTAAALDAFARRHALTQATLFQAAWALVLARYSGENDVIFGSVTSGRPPDLPGAEAMVGLLINTLPLRVHVPLDAPLLPWLAQLQELQFDLLRHQHASLAEISTLAELPSGQALFETILVYENYPLSGQMFERMESLGMSELRAWDKTNYPLTLAVSPWPNPMLQAVYDRRRYNASAIDKLLNHLTNLLCALPQSAERVLGELSLLDEAERRELVVDRNAAARTAYPERTLPPLFAERVALRPHAPALSYEGRQMSYAELASRARAWAGHLAECDIADEALVGIYLERSPEAIIAMLAALEAGGAYLPLDPSYPKERLAFMINDAGVRVIITNRRLRERLPEGSVEVLLADDLPSAGTSDRLLPDVCDPDRLAYVMYTSGSTGLPKAVEITHRGIVRLVSSGLFALGEDDVELQLVSLSFDPSALEIWSCLLGGGKLVLHPSRNPSLEEIGDALREHRITSTILITGLFPLMVDEHLEDLVGLRQLIVGGDVMPPGAAQRLLQAAPGLRLINAYGPTEAAIVATAHIMTEPAEVSMPIPIGRPVANAQIYLLDPTGSLAPDGLPGEIWIGGHGVARGYRGRPDLTAQRFAVDPFSERESARMYRTGDIGRWKRDGSLEFLGRVDAQVKIRGFRVEPGEIEAVLCLHPAVRECAVITYESVPGDRRLAAYIVPRAGENLQGSQLRAYLKSRLPEFMVPATFTLLEQLPRTVNDKVERSLLPKPGAGPSPRIERITPRTTVEKEIQAIWIEVLRIPDVGIDDDFFEIGGHSLLALQTVSRLCPRFGQLVRLGDLYQARTIRSLAAFLEEKCMVRGTA